MIRKEIVSAAKEHMVAMSQRAPPGHETKRQMECLHDPVVFENVFLSFSLGFMVFIGLYGSIQ